MHFGEGLKGWSYQLPWGLVRTLSTFNTLFDKRPGEAKTDPLASQLSMQ